LAQAPGEPFFQQIDQAATGQEGVLGKGMAEIADNVYIADLPGDVDDNLIHRVFGSSCTIMSCKTMQSKFPGQKGAALVRFATVEEATWVLQNFNGNIAPGLSEPIRVKYASRGGAGGGGYGKVDVPNSARSMPYSAGGGGGPESADNVYIADLPDNIDENTARTIFGAYGTVMSCKAMQSKFPGQKGAALVRFSNAEEAAWVVANLNGNIAEGLTEPVRVKFASRGGGKGAGGGSGGCGGGDGKGGGFGGFDGDGGDGGKGDGKGKGKPGITMSTSDIHQVLQGLYQTLPGSRRVPDDHQLYVEGLPANTTDLDLYKMFNPFGAIPSKGIAVKSNADGSCAGIGWVDFLDITAAQTAQSTLNGLILPDGCVLKLQPKRSKAYAPASKSWEGASNSWDGSTSWDAGASWNA